MAIAVKRILLVTRNVQFAIDSKRALEALGAYAVTTVTEARNAVEQLRRKPHHLALLDVENLAIAPEVMIQSIRARQGEIALVLAPNIPRAHELARDFAAQAVVDIPAPTRSLIPVLERSLKEMHEALTQTLKLPAVDPRDDTIEIEALVDDLLGDDALPSYTLQRLQASYRLLHPRAEVDPGSAALNAVELATEPGNAGETISYQRFRSARAEDNAASGGSSEQDENAPLPEANAESAPGDFAQVPAKNPLDADARDTTRKETLQQAPALDAISQLTLYENETEETSAAPPRQKPHWMKETEKFVREPDFLTERLPPLQPPAVPEQTTAPAPVELQENGAATEVADFESAASGNTIAANSHDSGIENPLRSRPADPIAARLAAAMIRMMPNLTAEATALTRNQALIAFAGAMPPDTLSALLSAIREDQTPRRNSARLRFVTVPENGKDYMLYSKATVHGLTLSLIFAGDKALSAISGQGDRLARALADAVSSEKQTPDSEQDLEFKLTPETADAILAPPPGKLTFAFLWLTANPATRINPTLAHQLLFQLEAQLNDLGWALRWLDAHPDFVHLVADVPATDAPEQLIGDLMQRSARIIRSQDNTMPEDLWADACLVAQARRELDARDLRKFRQFARSDRA